MNAIGEKEGRGRGEERKTGTGRTTQIENLEVEKRRNKKRKKGGMHISYIMNK